ncbi:MAG: RICIN domain-containing protein [Coriobacteriales bacterium]|nr:RICIN domain-containing protein [Coriobacteriales bacterium]
MKMPRNALRALASTLLAALLVLGTGAAPDADAEEAADNLTTQAAPRAEKGRTVADGVYTIGSALGRSYVLDVPGASDERGARVQLWRGNATPAQMFSFTLGADGYYTIRSVASGLALDVAAASKKPGAAVQQYTPNATAAQRWEVKEGAGGAWLLVCKASGLALCVSGGKAKQGALLVQGGQARRADRTFRLAPVTSEPLSAGYAEITPRAATSLRVDIKGASRASGADARAFEANGTAAQRFQVVRTSRSVYALRSLASGKYLTQEGADVIQRAAAVAGPTAHQRWRAAWAAGGVSLTNEATGDAMALSGRDVCAAAPRATAAQAWRLRPCVAVAPGTYALLSATGARAGVQGASLAAGADVRMQRPAAAGLSAGGGQKWELAYEGGGWYTLTNAASGMALDSGAATSSKAADVRQQRASKAASQRWRPVPTGDGWFWLQSKSGAWLAGTGTGGAGANAVAVTTNSDRKAQKFSFRATAYVAKPAIVEDLRSTLDHGPKPAAYQKYIVLHDTEGIASPANIISGWAGNGNLVAAHFIVDRDGAIHQCVGMDRIAHHAGYGDAGHNSFYGIREDGRDDMLGSKPIGSWAPDYGMNAWSIGIEMVHVSGDFSYPYTEAQLTALDDLIRYIDAYYGFKSKIIDHKAWRSYNSDTSAEFAGYLHNYQLYRHH